MSKSAAVLGLVAVASAAVAPAYGSESAPAYGGSSAPAYGGSSSAPVAPVSSSAPAYGGSSSSAVWSGVPSSSAPAYPGSSSAYAVPSSSSVVYYPSSSSSYYPSSSSAAPTTPPFPGCWSECFQEAGISSESDICGNAEVATCIHDKCDCADTSSYFSWYNSYCEVPSSSSSIPYYGSSSSSVVYYGSSSSSIPYSPVSSSASAPPSQPTIECWGKCFAENGITSEDQLCGNTAVDACISEGCDCEDDKAYWAWYESYCPAPSSSSASPTTPTVPATPTPTDCWSQCFEEAGIASEDELCGNTAVDQCISSTCSPAEDKAYWEWYLSYCPSTGPVTTPCVTPTGSATPSATPSSPVDSCWSSCFAENDVTSEASLCGNDDVSKCIHDTCSAAEDKAYWDWYNGFCVATSTGTTTVTTAYTPLTTPYSPVTTTYVSTETYGWGPATSGPATGLPTPPASPPAPYGGSWSPSSAAPVQPAGPTGTGYASPSASQWAPVPATGAGAVTKPGVFFAAAMALVALF